MNELKKIASSIYNVCYKVEKEITMHNETKARMWASANSLRHSHTIMAIINYFKNTRTKFLNILNASGLANGHQDFSIVYHLKNYMNINLNWVVYDSPENPYLNNPTLQKLLKRYNINLKLKDFSSAVNPYDERNAYDIILFTEIAEHLEHSTFLKCLEGIRNSLKSNGIVIFTSPNLLYAPHRIKFLLGNGDFYWGDGTENYLKGLYGHIVLYDINRLKRLFKDVGFSINTFYTFSYTKLVNRSSMLSTIKYYIKVILSNLFPNSKETLFIVLSKSQREKIPYQI